MLPPPPDIINYGNQNKTVKLEEPLEQKTCDILDLTVRRRAQPTPNIIDERHLSAPVEKRRYIEIDETSSQYSLRYEIAGSSTFSLSTMEPPLYTVTCALKSEDAHPTNSDVPAAQLTASGGAVVMSRNESSKVPIFPTHQLSIKPANGMTSTEARNNQNTTVITNQSVLYDSGSCIGYNGRSTEKLTPRHSPVQQSPAQMPQFSAIQNQGINRLQQNHNQAETIKRNDKGGSQIIRQPDASKACADPTVNPGIIAEALGHCLPQRTGYGAQYSICQPNSNQMSISEANMIRSKPSTIQYLPHRLPRQVGNQFLDTSQHGRMVPLYGNHQMPPHCNQSSTGQFLITPMFLSSHGSQTQTRLPIPPVFRFSEGESAYRGFQRAQNGYPNETSEANQHMNYSARYGTMSKYPMDSNVVTRLQSPGSIQNELLRSSKPQSQPQMPARYQSQEGFLQHSLPDHPERHLVDNDNKKSCSSNSLLENKQTGPQQWHGNNPNCWLNNQNRNVVLRALLPKALKTSDNSQQESPEANPLALLANLQPDGKSIVSLPDAANSNLQFRTNSCQGASNEQSIAPVNLITDSGNDRGSFAADSVVERLPNQLTYTMTSNNNKLTVKGLSTRDLKTYPVSTQNYRGKQDEEKSKHVCDQSWPHVRNMTTNPLAKCQDLNLSPFQDDNIHDGRCTEAKMQEADILAVRQKIAEVWSQIWSSTQSGDYDLSQKPALPFVQSVDEHEEAMKQLGLSKRSEQV